MLGKQATRLLASVVVGLSSLVAVGTVAQANPITVLVTGDVYEYRSYRYNYTTQGFDYYLAGSSGHLSGAFSWDPAFMGPDLSSPPTWSVHSGLLDSTAPWLTSRLTAVTPDFTRTYDPASSGSQQQFGALEAGNPSHYGGYSGLATISGYADHVDDVSRLLKNSLFLYDHSSPFTPTLGYRSGQFVPVHVNFALGRPDDFAALGVFESSDDPRGITLSVTFANLTNVTTVPEPGTVILVGAGLVGLVARRWRACS